MPDRRPGAAAAAPDTLKDPGHPHPAGPETAVPSGPGRSAPGAASDPPGSPDPPVSDSRPHPPALPDIRTAPVKAWPGGAVPADPGGRRRGSPSPGLRRPAPERRPPHGERCRCAGRRPASWLPGAAGRMRFAGWRGSPPPAEGFPHWRAPGTPPGPARSSAGPPWTGAAAASA